MKAYLSKLLPIITGATLLFSTTVFAETDPIPVDDIQRFTTAIKQIKSYYVKPVEDEKLFENAIRGMLTGLDPHSSYLDKDSFADMQTSTSGEFSGLGIEITMENGYVKVISPIEDTPAFKAGLKPGDYIVRLGEKSVKGMTLREAMNIMRGRRGTSITLTVVRQGTTEPLLITVTREQINIRSVKARMLDEGYAYIRINHFQEPTAKMLHKAFAKLVKESKIPLKGLALDLRNNPGGLLDSAIDVSDAFLDSTNIRKDYDDKIVFTEGRLSNSHLEAKATRGDMTKGIPMVVLVNGGSASGSEIVAGALQDYHRAVVLGTQTFGKGSVQTILPLGEDRGIKLTTALYYTPSGRSIQAKGISPDIVVDNIKIPEVDTKEDWLLEFLKESELSGHLENSTEGENKKVAGSADDEESEKLLHEDYQLYEALNLLKALSVTSTLKPS